MSPSGGGTDIPINLNLVGESEVEGGLNSMSEAFKAAESNVQSFGEASFAIADQLNAAQQAALKAAGTFGDFVASLREPVNIDGITMSVKQAQEALNLAGDDAKKFSSILNSMGGTNAAGGLKAVDEAAKQLQNDLRTLEAQAKTINFDGIAMSGKNAASLVNPATSSMSMLRQMEQELSPLANDAEKAGLSFFQLRTAMVGISALGGMNPMIGQMGAAFLNLSDIMPMVSVGMLGAAAGVAAVGSAMAGLATAAATFDENMTIVRNNTTMTDSEFGTMVSDVKQLAATSTQSTSDVAEGFRHIYNEGYSAADSVKVLAAANQMATATGAKTADTAQALSIYMHNFGIRASDAQKAENGLFISAAQGNMTMQQFAQYSERASAVMGVYKGSAADLGGALGVLTRSFGDASVAQTQFDSMIQHIVSPTASAQKALEDLSRTSGINLVHDFSQAGLAEVGLSGVMQDLNIALNGNYDEMQKLIPGIRGGQAALVLLKAAFGELPDSISKVQEGLDGKADPALQAYQREMTTTSGLSKELKTQLGLLAVGMGEGLSNAAGKGIRALLDIGDGFSRLGSTIHSVFVAATDAWNALPGPIKAIIQATPLGQTGTAAALVGKGISALTSANTDYGPSGIQHTAGTTGYGAETDTYLAGMVGANSEVDPSIARANAQADATAAYEAKKAAAAQAAALNDTAAAAQKAAEQQQNDAQTAAYEAAAQGLSRKELQAKIDLYNGMIKTQTVANDQAKEDTDAQLAHAAALKADKEAAANLTDATAQANKQQADANDTIGAGVGALKSLTDQRDAFQAAMDKMGPKASGGGGDPFGKQDQLNAQEAVQKTQKEIEDLKASITETTDQINTAFHAVAAGLHEQQVAAQSVVDTDKTSYETLKQGLDAVKYSTGLTAEQKQKMKAVIDSEIGSLNNENDALGSNKDILIAAKSALDEMTGSEKTWKAEIDQAKAAVQAQSDAVKAAQDTLKNDQNTLKAAQQDLTNLKNTLTDLTSALSSAKTAESDFAQAMLPGQQAFNDQTAAMKQQENQLQLQIDQIIGADLANGMTQSAANADPALTKLQAQMDILKNQEEQVQLQGSITFDPMTTQIKDLEQAGNKFDFGSIIDALTKAQNAGQGGLDSLIADLSKLNGTNTANLSFDQITQGITLAQEAQQKLTTAIPGATAAVDAQQSVVDGLTSKVDADNAALQKQQEILQSDQKALQDAQSGYQKFQQDQSALAGALGIANTNLQTASQDLGDLGKALGEASKAASDAKNAAVDPLKESVNTLNDQLSTEKDSLDKINNIIKQHHINIMNDAAKAAGKQTGGLADVLKVETVPALDTTGGQAVTTGTQVKGLADVTANNPDSASKAADVLAKTLKGTLHDDMQNMIDPTQKAADAMTNFAIAMERAQADAAKGVNLTIHINTVGGGSSSAVAAPGGGGGGTDASAAVASGNPSFDLGGIVPGSGPQFAIVHGGETVLPPGAFSKPLPLSASGGSTTNMPPINVQAMLLGTNTELVQQLARLVYTEIERLVQTRA